MTNRSTKISIPVVTTETLDRRAHETLGPVWCAACCSKHVLADVAANLKSWTTGGELNAYSRLLESTAGHVITQLADKAAAQGADAVVSVRLVTSQVAQGAAELVAYGTAVKLRG